MLERMWRNRNTFTVLLEDGVVIFKDLEIAIPFDPAIPLLGIYPKD